MTPEQIARKKATVRAWYDRNKEHKLEYSRQWRIDNKERSKETAAAWLEAHPNYQRERHLITTYNLTASAFNHMVSEQEGKCALCGCTPEGNLYVDHDHQCCLGEKSCGRCVRGLLCQPCNTGIGMLQDDPNILVKAADYITRHRLG